MPFSASYKKSFQPFFTQPTFLWNNRKGCWSQSWLSTNWPCLFSFIFVYAFVYVHTCVLVCAQMPVTTFCLDVGLKGHFFFKHPSPACGSLVKLGWPASEPSNLPYLYLPEVGPTSSPFYGAWPRVLMFVWQVFYKLNYFPPSPIFFQIWFSFAN